MPEITPEGWGQLYDRAFPQVYRALVAATFDRERALDGLHDAFEEGLRHPPAHDGNLEGWLYRVALRKIRRGLFRARREEPISEGSSQEEIADALGIRRGTVSATVSQSLAHMREEGIARG